MRCGVGHVEVVKLLVSRGADKSSKDKQGYTPLHAAAASGYIEIVKYLLRMGAEVRQLTVLFLGHPFQFESLGEKTACGYFTPSQD